MRAELDIAKRKHLETWPDKEEKREEPLTSFGTASFGRPTVSVSVEVCERETSTHEIWRKAQEGETEKGVSQWTVPAHLLVNFDGRAVQITPESALVFAAMLQASAKAAFR